MTSALWSLANFLIALAASTASPLTNAIAVGPTNSSSSPSTPASDAARLISVFLATEYVAEPDSDRRSSARLATVRPRYSVITVAVELLNCSAMSATAVALSAWAMHSSLGSRPGNNERPDAGSGRGVISVGARPTKVCLVLLRRPPGSSRTFNRLLGDRRSSVDRRQPYRGLPPAAKTAPVTPATAQIHLAMCPPPSDLLRPAGPALADESGVRCRAAGNRGRRHPIRGGGPSPGAAPTAAHPISICQRDRQHRIRERQAPQPGPRWTHDREVPNARSGRSAVRFLAVFSPSDGDTSVRHEAEIRSEAGNSAHGQAERLT